jgi:hypothetical protein
VHHRPGRSKLCSMQVITAKENLVIIEDEAAFEVEG